MEWLFSLFVFAFLAASFTCWSTALRRLRARGRLLPFEPRRAAPWGLVDLGLAFVLLLGLQYIAIDLWSAATGSELGKRLEELSPAQRADVVIAGGAASLATVVFSAVLISLRTGAGARDYGFRGGKVASDLKLGASAFLMMAPPVYGIQWLLLKRFESKHPLVELLQKQPSLSFVLVTLFAAVVVAPLAEEYLFRVLLQGWLEKAAAYRGPVYRLLLGDEPDLPSSSIPAANDAARSADPSAFEASCADHGPSAGQAADQRSYPFAPSAVFPYASPAEVGATEEAESGRTASWPILVSAAAFSLMHVSHGPDWAPLFLLAVGLGYLYHRTHRVLPCIVVHFLLNSFSMAALLIDVFAAVD